VFNELHLGNLVMIGLVLRLPKFMLYYAFSPGFIFSYLSTGQQIGWKERLEYDLYCVEWDVKPQLNQLVSFLVTTSVTTVPPQTLQVHRPLERRYKMYAGRVGASPYCLHEGLW